MCYPSIAGEMNVEAGQKALDLYSFSAESATPRSSVQDLGMVWHVQRLEKVGPFSTGHPMSVLMCRTVPWKGDTHFIGTIDLLYRGLCGHDLHFSLLEGSLWS